MPQLVTRANFSKDGTTITVRIEAPWWNSGLFRTEVDNDTQVNLNVYEAVRDALDPLGFKEVDA